MKKNPDLKWNRQLQKRNTRALNWNLTTRLRIWKTIAFLRSTWWNILRMMILRLIWTNRMRIKIVLSIHYVVSELRSAPLKRRLVLRWRCTRLLRNREFVSPRFADWKMTLHWACLPMVFVLLLRYRVRELSVLKCRTRIRKLFPVKVWSEVRNSRNPSLTCLLCWERLLRMKSLCSTFVKCRTCWWQVRPVRVSLWGWMRLSLPYYIRNILPNWSLCWSIRRKWNLVSTR